MKNLPRILKYVGLIIGVSSIFTALAFATRKSAKITFEDDTGITIHPFTQISERDEKAMNDVLKKYDKSLYKIQTYKEGKLQKTKGRLEDVYIARATIAELTEQKGTGGSARVLQVANISGPSRPPQVGPTRPSKPAPTPTSPSKGSTSPTNPTRPAPTPTNPSGPPKDVSDVKELVRRLRPILEKYSK
jgi:hypothetical protein